MGKVLEELRDDLKEAGKLNMSSPNQHDKAKVEKPKIVLIGNSLLKDIKPEKLIDGAETTKEMAYTISDATKVVEDMEITNLEAVVFQLITNDVKELTPENVADNMASLVEKTSAKFPSSKILVSQALNRADSKMQHLLTQQANILAEEKLPGYTVIVDNSSIPFQERYFTDDKVHLTGLGSSALANNIKKQLEKSLNIKPSESRRNPPSPQRSPYHQDYNRGRGGRGRNNQRGSGSYRGSRYQTWSRQPDQR